MSLSKEIIEILDYLGRKFGIAIDWTSENVVPYIEDLCARYIKFEIYTSIMWVVLCVGIMALAGLIWIISGIVDANGKTCSDLTQGTKYTAMFVFWVFFVISLIVGGYQAWDIIECYTLPEKVILEYLKTLIDSAK